jgi:amidase
VYDRRDFLKTAGATLAFGAASGALDPADAAPPELPTSVTDLCFTSARDLAALIRARKLSARECMSAHLAQIARVNPKVNAIVAKLDDEQCLALADAADRRASRKEPLGPLHGLPIAFKDLQPAVGFPYTRGSTIYRGFMPTEDSVLVERLRAAGAIPIGKTNVPEFGMGSHTYNKVYGTTFNPYDLTKSAGGSSGGAAASLASGMLPIADGSDYGGSLRNPANFDNVVGMRPSVGLVPVAPSQLPFLGFSVVGPMARTVGDVGLLLSVMAGADRRDPISYPSEPSTFLRTDGGLGGARVAWCPDLGGLPLDPRVRAVLEPHRATLERLGCVVENACPDFAGADDLFRTIRGFRSAALYGPLLEKYRDQIKQEAIGEIEAGLTLTGRDVARAMTLHGQLMERMRRFEERYDYLVCAVNQVPPFDASIEWPKSVDGVVMEDYLSWMKSAYLVTATFRPAISVPAGFTPDGLPVGIQIVGRFRDDLSVLRLAQAFEQATSFGRRRPPIAESA